MKKILQIFTIKKNGVMVVGLEVVLNIIKNLFRFYKS